MKQAGDNLREALAAIRNALASIRAGELFETLAWLHSAKENIGKAEQIIESERVPLIPPQQTGE
jgi:hypothetical protein